MILHVSINAEQPKRMAEVIAWGLGGTAARFPPFPESWIAFSKADDGTAIEVYPLTHRLVPGPEQIECQAEAARKEFTFVHLALAGVRSRDELSAMGGKQGWTTRICDRGPFECVEMWAENRLLIEWLDYEMLADYRREMTLGNWVNMFSLDA